LRDTVVSAQLVLDAPASQDASRSVKQLWVGEWQATKSIAMDEPVTASCLLGIFIGGVLVEGRRVKNGQVKTTPSEVGDLTQLA